MTDTTDAVERLREALTNACRLLDTGHGNALVAKAHRLLRAALSPVDRDNGGEAIPAGMKAYGPEHPDYPNEPSDWDGEQVQFRIGDLSMKRPGEGLNWRHQPGSIGEAVEIIAYTPKPASDNIGGAVECASSPLPSGKHQVDTSMESGPNHCFFCEQPMPASPSPQGKPSLDGESGK